MELLHTVDGQSWIYVEGKPAMNFLERRYGKKSIVATYHKKGIYGWNFNVPFDDLRELRQELKTIYEKGNTKDERSKPRSKKRSRS